MAKRSKRSLPTQGQFLILHVLWKGGPQTVRQIHNALGRPHLNYTHTLRPLQVMLKEELVKRDESSRAHVYRAAIRKNVAQWRLLSHVAGFGFGGSFVDLVCLVIGKGVLSASDQKRCVLTMAKGAK